MSRRSASTLLSRLYAVVPSFNLRIEQNGFAHCSGRFTRFPDRVEFADQPDRILSSPSAAAPGTSNTVE